MSQYAEAVNSTDEPGSGTRTRSDLADQLRRAIDEGTYPVGSKLPSYRELAAEFGAARNTVGEAVKLLAAEGRVEIRPNARAVVRDPAEAPPSTPATRSELIEVHGRVRAARKLLNELDTHVAALIDRLPPE